MAHDVFISYSSKDKPIADAVCARIEAAGIRCWIAPRDIAPGEDWPAAISSAIEASRVMVLIFSSNSNSSDDVSRELSLAASSKLIIIPFKIDDIKPEPGKQYYLARTHWLDAMNPPTEEEILVLVDRAKSILANLDAERTKKAELARQAELAQQAEHGKEEERAKQAELAHQAELAKQEERAKKIEPAPSPIPPPAIPSKPPTFNWLASIVPPAFMLVGTLIGALISQSSLTVTIPMLLMTLGFPLANLLAYSAQKKKYYRALAEPEHAYRQLLQDELKQLDGVEKKQHSQLEEGYSPAPQKTGRKPAGRKVGLAVGGVFLFLLVAFGVYYGITRLKPAAETPAAPTLTSTESAPVTISWYLGLGGGTDTDQIAIYEQLMEEFNASHENIRLVLEAVPRDGATIALHSLIDSGNGPDVIGPQSMAEASPFHGQWLDLTPYLDQVDTAQYNPILMSMYLTDEGQVALPFMVSPAVMFYNPALFDAAGLNYPPSHYGDEYVREDGSSVTWDWWTVAEVARLMTLDSGGRSATEPYFLENNIVQYGFDWIWNTGPIPYFGGGSYLEGMPGAWKDAWEWTYDGFWGAQPFMPPGQSGFMPDDNNTFATGKVAMTAMPAWYLYNLKDYVEAGNTFDIGILPAYNSSVHGRMDDASFRIWKDTPHPAEAFEVMYWLETVGIDRLLSGTVEDYAIWPPILPGITALQQDAITNSTGFYSFVTHWDVLVDSIAYPDLVYLHNFRPNLDESLNSFTNKMRNDENFDLVEEIDLLDAELQVLFNE